MVEVPFLREWRPAARACAHGTKTMNTRDRKQRQMHEARQDIGATAGEGDDT